MALIEGADPQVIVSPDAYDETIDLIRGASVPDLTISFSGYCQNVNQPIGFHPDVQFCRLGFNEISPVFAGTINKLASRYPNDVIYNAACTGKYFIHNLDYTDPSLFSVINSLGMESIHVRQGYTKCSTVIIDESSIITYDKGIALPCQKAGLDVLLVSPGHILLPGMNEGFIGGTSGRVGNSVIFNGDLTEHPDHQAIIHFIESHKLQCLWVPGKPLIDIGSIL